MAEIEIGQKLQRHLDELSKSLGKGGVVKVGFLSKSTYPDGTPVAMIAAIQDYGAPTIGIPPRPFFRNMVREKSDGWAAAIELNLKATNYDTQKTMALVGEGIAGQLKQSIIDTNEPPLKPATIARKGFDKPLIDTSVLINSVDYEVKV